MVLLGALGGLHPVQDVVAVPDTLFVQALYTLFSYLSRRHSVPTLGRSCLEASIEEAGFAGWIRKHKHVSCRPAGGAVTTLWLLRCGFGVEAEGGGVDAVALA